MRAFAANIYNPRLDARDRAWRASLVSQRTGLSQADAEKRVDEAFVELKAAEQKARDAACAGTSLGARHRDDRTLGVLSGSRRFW